MPLELIPHRAPASPAVYLLLCRAVPTLDGWIAELRKDADIVSLIEALSIHLAQRRRDFTPADAAKAQP